MPLSARERRRLVTEEPQRIHPDLLGRPLASPWRRAIAMGLDLLVAAIPLMAILLAVTIWSVDREQPGFLTALQGGLTATDDSLRAAQSRLWRRHLVLYVAERRPEALPDSIRAALDGGDPAPLEGYLDELGRAETYGIAIGEQEKPLYDAETGTLALDFTVVTGRWIRFLGAFFGVVAWLGLMGWAMRGRSPGKALLGIRAVRLDGRPPSLWSAWGRAGAYGASLGTIGLGLLQILWDPNRQAVHDRIAGTVVLREPRRARRGRRAEQENGSESAAAGGTGLTDSDTPPR